MKYGAKAAPSMTRLGKQSYSVLLKVGEVSAGDFVSGICLIFGFCRDCYNIVLVN
jgi:hypothetical protein